MTECGCPLPAHRFAFGGSEERLRCDCGAATAEVTFTRGGGWRLQVVDAPAAVEDE